MNTRKIKLWIAPVTIASMACMVQLYLITSPTAVFVGLWRYGDWLLLAPLILMPIEAIIVSRIAAEEIPPKFASWARLLILMVVFVAPVIMATALDKLELDTVEISTNNLSPAGEEKIQRVAVTQDTFPFETRSYSEVEKIRVVFIKGAGRAQMIRTKAAEALRQ
jgi:hypothetical protein